MKIHSPIIQSTEKIKTKNLNDNFVEPQLTLRSAAIFHRLAATFEYQM